MTRLAFILACLAAPAPAALVATWDGPGPHPCRDACPLTWFEAHLTDDEMAALADARARQPEPQPLLVYDGDVFRLMSYAPGGQPVAYRTTTVATLDAPEPAEGWVVGRWALVRLEACGNWAILERGQHVPTGGDAVYAGAAGFTASDVLPPRANPVPQPSPLIWRGSSGPVPEHPAPDDPDPAPVPLPWAGLMLIAALAALKGVRRWL